MFRGIVASMAIDGGERRVLCSMCGREADRTAWVNGRSHTMCDADYRKWAHAVDREQKLLHKSSKRTVERLTVRAANAELSVEPSFMERALIEQEIEARQNDITAAIEAFGKALNDDE